MSTQKTQLVELWKSKVRGKGLEEIGSQESTGYQYFRLSPLKKSRLLTFQRVDVRERSGPYYKDQAGQGTTEKEKNAILPSPTKR